MKTGEAMELRTSQPYKARVDNFEVHLRFAPNYWPSQIWPEPKVDFYASYRVYTPRKLESNSCVVVHTADTQHIHLNHVIPLGPVWS